MTVTVQDTFWATGYWPSGFWPSGYWPQGIVFAPAGDVFYVKAMAIAGGDWYSHETTMQRPYTLTGSSPAGSSPTLLARIETTSGDPIDFSDVASVGYRISYRQSGDYGDWSPVANHKDQVLASMTVLLDDLSTEVGWGDHVDDVGHNFRLTLDEQFGDPLPTVPGQYSIDVELQSIGDANYVAHMRFEIYAT